MADEVLEGTKATVTTDSGIGEGFGSIPSKTEVTVTHILDPNTSGVGSHDEKTIRVEFDEPGLTLNEDGHSVFGSVRRAISLSVSEFNRLFQKVGD